MATAAVVLSDWLSVSVDIYSSVPITLPTAHSPIRSTTAKRVVLIMSMVNNHVNNWKSTEDEVGEREGVRCFPGVL